MYRKALKHWLLVGALGVSLLGGCKQAPLRSEHIGADRPVSYVLTGSSPYQTAREPVIIPATAPPPVVVTSQPTPVTRTTHAPPIPVTTQPPPAPVTAHIPPIPVGPTITVAQEPTPAHLGIALAHPATPLGEPVFANAPPPQSVTRVGFEPPPGDELPALPSSAPVVSMPCLPRSEPTPARKSYVDLTAAPCFGHAPDYQWINGQVEYSHITKEWRLRYASVDEVDQYGGHVVLVENHHATLLRDGQLIHALGHLVNSENHEGASPYYRVESFKTIEDPNASGPTSGAK